VKETFMKKSIQGVLFSPTGTCRAVVEGMRYGTEREMGTVVDLTWENSEPVRFGKNDLVVVGMPVYAGRLPRLAVERFAAIHGDDTPVAAVVVYGNRAYDDALLELCDLCVKQGFRVVGAAAFIGEHSFSSAEVPIAQGRPDQDDLQKAEQFGQRIAGKNEALDLSQIPGNRPYKDDPIFPGAATGTDLSLCTRCGQCVEVCPSDAISMTDDGPETDPDLCLWCEACVRVCSTQARSVVSPKIDEIAARLHQTCNVRLEPAFWESGSMKSGNGGEE
jgi:ferredoxin